MRNTRQKLIAVVTFALLAMTATGTLQAQSAQQTTKGARPITLTPIHTQAQVDALTRGGTVAMVCGMCKSVTLENYKFDADSKAHVKYMVPGTKMDCPMCGGKISIVGGGAGKQTDIRHICSKCGGESAFCCVTPKGQKIEGMQGMNGVNGMKMP